MCEYLSLSEDRTFEENYASVIESKHKVAKGSYDYETKQKSNKIWRTEETGKKTSKNIVLEVFKKLSRKKIMRCRPMVKSKGKTGRNRNHENKEIRSRLIKKIVTR